MTATISRLRLPPTFTIEVSADGPRPVGSFAVGDGVGTVVPDLSVSILEPAFLSAGAPCTSRVIAIGDLGRELRLRAGRQAFSMRCRAVPDGTGWKMVEVLE